MIKAGFKIPENASVAQVIREQFYAITAQLLKKRQSLCSSQSLCGKSFESQLKLLVEQQNNFHRPRSRLCTKSSIRTMGRLEPQPGKLENMRKYGAFRVIFVYVSPSYSPRD